MLKLLGSACILSGGALAWLIQRLERRRKRDALSDLLRAFRRMGETIRMARTSLPLLLESLAEDCGPDASAFFTAAAKAAQRGESLREAWKKASELLPLAPVDKKAIAELGAELHGDEESVCKALSLVTYQLAQSGEELERSWMDLEKQAAALWFSAAALLVILLI